MRSEKDCFYWAEIAASKGHEWAKFNLAVYHNEGRKTCSKAPSKAKKLFKELLESTKNQEVRDKIRWYIGTHPEINGSFETQSSEENTNVDSLNMEASDNIKNGAAKKSASSLMGIGMQVLGGFVAVLGLAAVASGIVLLAAVSASAGLIVAGSGLAALACGLGLFAGGRLYHHWNGSSQSLNQPLKI